MNDVPIVTTNHTMGAMKALPASLAATNSADRTWRFSPFAAASAAKAMPLIYCLLDQGFSVGGVFLANVMLARTQSKEEYGMFALSYSIYTFLSGVNNASILEPYTVYGSGRYRDRLTAYVQLMARSSGAVALALTVALLLGWSMFSGFVPQLSLRALLGLALTVGALLFSSFVRRAFYVQGAPELAARTSTTFFILVAVGLLISSRLHLLSSFTVFLVLGAAWIGACAGSARKLLARKPGHTFLETEPKYWQEHWKYTKWVLGTALVFQLTTQGYYWLVAAFLSLKDVAQLKAIYLLVMPVDQVFIALNYLVLPAMARHYAAGRMREYFTFSATAGLATVCMTGLFAMGIRICGRSVMHVLYAGEFDGVAPLLFILALLPLTMGIGNTMNDALKAAEMPKMVFYAYLSSGGATLFAGMPLVRQFGLKGAVYGMLVSGTTYSAFLALAFLILVSRRPREESASALRISPSPDLIHRNMPVAVRVPRARPGNGLSGKLAPVVLFAYNRPMHTRRTVESLRTNHLAPESALFVYCDGAKNQADKPAVDEVRRYVHGIQGFRSVTICERERNAGLAQSVIGGVTEMFQRSERLIVLEDDLLTTPDFLNFMNAVLERYQHETKIFSATGFSHAVSMPEGYKYDAVCSHRSCSWGWGTWKDRWERADWEISDYAEFRADKNRRDLLNRGGADLSYMLDLQMAGAIDSWAIRWAYAHFKHDAVALVSTSSKVYNIGFDGSGVHCRRASTQQASLARDERLIWNFPDSLEVDPFFRAKLCSQHPRPTAGRRLWRSLRHKIESKVSKGLLHGLERR